MDLMYANQKAKESILKGLREEFPKGTRVELVEMNDEYTKIEPGTKGTVDYVDDIGTIHMSWDTGSSLGVAYGVDKVKKLEI